MADDWTHYGTHADAMAAADMRSRQRTPGFERHALHCRLEWLPESHRESWDTLFVAGFKYYACMVDKRTGEIQRWVSRSRSFGNVWKNRNHPAFPWEFLTIIKITK